MTVEIPSRWCNSVTVYSFLKHVQQIVDIHLPHIWGKVYVQVFAFRITVLLRCVASFEYSSALNAKYCVHLCKCKNSCIIQIFGYKIFSFWGRDIASHFSE